jgi:hypothetical protein
VSGLITDDSESPMSRERSKDMGIEQHEGGGMTITGLGDMPEGGLSFYTLLTAWQAAKMHIETGGRIKMTRNATPSNLVPVLNQHYPDRPDGPFKGRTMKVLLPQIVAEVKRQRDLRLAADPEAQTEAMDRIIREADEMGY